MSLEDPFFVVKEEVQKAVNNVQTLYRRWQDLLDNPRTVGKDEYNWTTNELRNNLRSIEWDLEDLDETVGIVEANPRKFNIDISEVNQRKLFIKQTRDSVNNIKEHMNSPSAKAKVENSSRDALLGRRNDKPTDRYSRLDKEIENSNQSFITDQQQQQELMIQAQDDQLDMVGHSVGVLKTMGKRIGDEIEEQNLILDDFGHELEMTDSKLQQTVLKVEKVLRLSDGSSIYRRSIFSESHSFSGSQDETDSDAETVCSVQSEFILRPHMSARQRYFSTYNLNPISEITSDPRDIMVNHKWRSMPELARSNSLGSSGDFLHVGFDEKKPKKKRRKFGRRSGLYIVNDVPVSEKPRLSVDKGKSKSKIFSKKSKKQSLHVNELTKKWFDSRTAVSRPTGGQSLGRIVAMREDLGSAYVLELQRCPGGLFGFFIQKGFNQYRKGVFVSRIMDGASAKFMAGLLNPGDEILEINGENTSCKTMSEVHNILANSDKLNLTVLPILGRKDW
ncbi:uncharacterized protein [Porites lutea]|uniref:uncharacterized protein isoform X2 n=1 Tax=Porites lutea TaxID=51062 RepID=UPI003CC55848